ARVGAVGRRSQRDLGDLAGRVLEVAVDIRGRLDVAAVDREEILARLRVHTGLGERRAHLWIPVQATVDLLQPVAAVLDAVISAEQSTRHARRRDPRVTAASAMVADG